MSEGRFRVVLSEGRSRGLVHLAREVLDVLGLRSGGTARLKGAYAIHVSVAAGQIAPGRIALDAEIAQNAGLDAGGTARLSPLALPTPETVLLNVRDGTALAPAQPAETLFDMTLSGGDNNSVPRVGGHGCILGVFATSPSIGGLLGEETIVTVEARPSAQPVLQGVGTLRERIARVEKMIAAPLKRPDLFDRLGISPSRGVLFTGPPGSGKTLLAHAVAAHTEAAFFHFAGLEILSHHFGDSEEALRRVFDAAARRVPSICFIDELDAIAPGRDTLSGEKQVEWRVVAQLLTLLVGIEGRVRCEHIIITSLDFDQGLAATGPSALRGACGDSAPVSWDDVGGAESARTSLNQTVTWSMRHRTTAESLGLRPARGVLQTGSPGSGKTLVPRALATESAMNFLPVWAQRLLSRYLGEAERAVAELFVTARAAVPTLMFFDELDALAPCRTSRGPALERIVAQLPVEFDGFVMEPAMVPVATIQAAAIDPALNRPGRFDSIVDFDLRDETACEAILAIHLEGHAQEGPMDTESLGRATVGFSDADVANLFDEAARTALARQLEREARTVGGLSQDDLGTGCLRMRKASIACGADHVGGMAGAMQ